ncbi:hypothetical protein pb186bvf_015133 [Paramecium bursaria]
MFANMKFNHQRVYLEKYSVIQQRNHRNKNQFIIIRYVQTIIQDIYSLLVIYFKKLNFQLFLYQQFRAQSVFQNFLILLDDPLVKREETKYQNSGLIIWIIRKTKSDKQKLIMTKFRLLAKNRQNLIVKWSFSRYNEILYNLDIEIQNRLGDLLLYETFLIKQTMKFN